VFHWPKESFQNPFRSSRNREFFLEESAKFVVDFSGIAAWERVATGGTMKLYTGKIPPLAHDLVDALIKAKAIEVLPDEVKEVEMDVESVLKEYVRVDREVTDRARDVIAAEKRDYSELNKVKSQIARDRNFGIGESMGEYISAQLIEALLHSRHVEEVFGQDNELVMTMQPILRKHLAADEELDGEVRTRIKNLQEGTMAWDIQYRRVMDELKRSTRRGD